MSEPNTSLTIEQAISILERSERGRAVARQLYDLLDGSCCIGLDIEGKMAVLSLIEEAFINRPGTVLDMLGESVRAVPR